MDKKSVFFIAFLGFILPGLGHLYIGKFFRGVCLFSSFIILIIFPKLTIFALFVAFYSAWEALHLSKDFSSPNHITRKILYSVVGIFAFTFWMVLLAPVELKDTSHKKLVPKVFKIE